MSNIPIDQPHPTLDCIRIKGSHQPKIAFVNAGTKPIRWWHQFTYLEDSEGTVTSWHNETVSPPGGTGVVMVNNEFQWVLYVDGVIVSTYNTSLKACTALYEREQE